jgi:uncharacterized secreted protein with C-terminal beta-propeller domain
MKQIFSYILPALLIGIYLIGIVILNLQTQKVAPAEEIQVNKEKFRTFYSIEEIKSFIARYSTQQSDFLFRLGSTIEQFSGPPSLPAPIPTPTVIRQESTQSTPSYYSKTNVQVEGVDEPDVVKTDGMYIYAVTDKGIVIVKAYPVEESGIISKIDLKKKQNEPYLYYEFQILLYVYNNKLIVIDRSVVYNEPLDVYFTDIYSSRYYKPPVIYTNVLIYDIKDRAQPKLEWNVTIEGDYVASRMIEENVYIITASPVYLQYEITLPTIYDNNKEIKVKPNNIYYTPYIDTAFRFTLLVHLNLMNKSIEYKGFLLGVTNTIYVSLKNIYITQYIYSQRWIGRTSTITSEQDYTIIHRINIQNGIRYEAAGKVPGFVLNQFSMDEYEEYFRVATTSMVFDRETFTTTSNNIYILNMDLKIIGKIEGIEKGERIYAARFVQEKCYLVTFRQIDPFFVIDLSNVQEPKILGYLKIPGFSTYLHPINETMVLGIGEEGWRKIKISLFDVSDFNNPKEISKIIIGNQSDYAYSEALHEHKAFLYDPKRKLVILPFTIEARAILPVNVTMLQTTYKYSLIVSYDWNGFLVFEIKDKIYLKGNITQAGYEDMLERVKDIIQDLMRYNWNYGYSYQIINLPVKFMRVLFIEDFLYTLSNLKLKINNIHTLEEIKEIKF